MPGRRSRGGLSCIEPDRCLLSTALGFRRRFPDSQPCRLSFPGHESAGAKDEDRARLPDERAGNPLLPERSYPQIEQDESPLNALPTAAASLVAGLGRPPAPC